jgi:hypothetical protein
VLRPAVAQERVELRPDGLVRITLKKAYADRTIAVDMDPLSLLWSASHPRAPTAPAHHPLRGSAGPGEPGKLTQAPPPPAGRPPRPAGSGAHESPPIGVR